MQLHGYRDMSKFLCAWLTVSYPSATGSSDTWVGGRDRTWARLHGSIAVAARCAVVEGS